MPATPPLTLRLGLKAEGVSCTRRGVAELARPSGGLTEGESAAASPSTFFYDGWRSSAALVTGTWQANRSQT